MTIALCAIALCLFFDEGRWRSRQALECQTAVLERIATALECLRHQDEIRKRGGTP